MHKAKTQTCAPSENLDKALFQLKRIDIFLYFSMKIGCAYSLEDWHSGSVGRGRLGGCGFNPSQVIPKTLNMVLAALSLGAQH